MFAQEAPIGFYVYRLVDPRTMRPFYIGKGKGRRAWHHEKDARAGRIMNARKHERIMDIVQNGYPILVDIAAVYQDERDAFEHEIELIATTPDLTNILKGGQGASLMAAECAVRAEERRARVAHQKAVHNQARLRDWLKMVERWPNGGTFPTLRNGDALAAEFINTVRDLVAIPIHMLT